MLVGPVVFFMAISFDEFDAVLKSGLSRAPERLKCSKQCSDIR